MRILNLRGLTYMVKIGFLTCLEAAICILDVLENFAKFTGKHLCLQPATLLRKRQSRVFSCEFSGVVKNTLIYRYLRATASACYFSSGKW